MDMVAIGRVRRFQRTVTQRIGALNDRFLARDRPLGQARLLWEIGADGSEVRALRARLELDSGYLSRLLRSLEADGLIVVDDGDSDGSDGRVRTARLTATGLAERRELDHLADDAAAAMLEPLSPRQRERLVSAMAEVERLLLASTVTIDVRDPRHPQARHCVQTYFAELSRRFEEGFDPARSLSADEHELRPPAGMLLVASLRAEPVGCVAIKFHADAGAAQLKRMWVDQDTRGLGLGRRLLAEAERRAADNGLGLVRLETHRALTEAIALYRSAGYREVPPFNEERYAHHWFEKRLAD
ncbi:MarR family winged helix-turn-helix transcriptional regulator [Actinomadura sp. ATCC 31491]|uniref:MarR family winged helix-turn-helix transcriptional regulator n=1 Tax=Actinomadura luzonensis TaxID=2805427 RepID=A0ABT0G0X5_9ACTN|nr:MarR family winged helix-turn-helix transcriptional regulator [Actinomadura luzonensis]MCK2217830.1 MarR family winged helix-turn-helix transcriptional regulator [Actinomadura luzonensis]